MLHASLVFLFLRPQVMEAREEVEETEDVAKLQRLLQANRQQQQDIVRRLSRAFDSPSGSRCA